MVKKSWRWIAVVILLAPPGCRGGGPVSTGLAPKVATESPVSIMPAGFEDRQIDQPANLSDLWRLAESSHPELLTAQIDLDAKQRQVATAKHSIETQLACAQQQAAVLALLQKRAELMGQVRSGFYRYAASEDLSDAYGNAIERLEEDIRRMRVAVEDGKTQPRSNLISLQATFEQTKAAAAKAKIERSAVWRRLAIEVGAPRAVVPDSVAALPENLPNWGQEQLQQLVLSENLRLQQAIQAERVARLSLQQLSQSWIRRRRESQLIEAEAAVGKARALTARTAQVLMQETDASLARYEALRLEWRSLRDVVQPQRLEQLRLVEQQFEIGAIGGTMPELLAARQAVSDVRLQIATKKVELWLAIAEIEALIQAEIDGAPEVLDAAPPPLPVDESR